MSYKYSAKEDRKEEAKMTAAAEKKESVEKNLQKALEDKGVSFSSFRNADEHYRKRALKEDYAELKLKYGWLYDQPIEG